jgi:hypothetical protein
VRSLIALAAIAALAMTFGACGGGSDSSGSTGTKPKSSSTTSPAGPNAALENSPFGKKVTSVCFLGTRGLGSLPRFPFPAFDPLHPEVSKLPAIARYFENGSLPVYQKLIAGLKKVKPPPAQKQKYDEFLHQLDLLAANLKRQIAAAKSSDSKGFTATVKTAGGTGLPNAESALGIRACYGIS